MDPETGYEADELCPECREDEDVLGPEPIDPDREREDEAYERWRDRWQGRTQ
jgi:hypothetical protein